MKRNARDPRSVEPDGKPAFCSKWDFKYGYPEFDVSRYSSSGFGGPFEWDSRFRRGGLSSFDLADAAKCRRRRAIRHQNATDAAAVANGRSCVSLGWICLRATGAS